VHVVVDGEPVQKNHVYVLPSDVMLGVEKGHLRLHPQNALHRERKPIDLFFSSLAEDRASWRCAWCCPAVTRTARSA
jgi:two-component system CheB/CheR fusion protein